MEPLAPPDEIDLRPYIAGMFRRWWIIALCLAVGIGFSVFNTMRDKPIYRAYTVLLLPMTPTAGSAASLLGGGAPTPLSYIKGILESDTAVDRVAKKMKIDPEKFRKSVAFTTTEETNQIQIAADHASKDTAVQIVKEIRDNLDEMNRMLAGTMSSEQAGNLRSALDEQQSGLRTLEKEYLQFQRTAKTGPSPDPMMSGAAQLQQRINQARVDLRGVSENLSRLSQSARNMPGGEDATITNPTIANWRNKVVEADFEYNRKRIQFGDGVPEVVRLRRELDLARQTLDKEQRNYIRSITKGLDDRTVDLLSRQASLQYEITYLTSLRELAPGENLEMQRLASTLALKREVVRNLSVAYEQARASQSTNVTVYSTLTHPRALKDPINKSLSRAVLFGGIAGLLLGLVVAALASARGVRPRK